MQVKKSVTFIIGTRPEAIKLAMVIKEFDNSKFFKIRVVLTGQHKEMVNEVLDIFRIKANNNLEVMVHNQSLNYVVSETIRKLNDELMAFPPDLIFVQGDTSSALAGALSAFHLKIPIAHIEAGLRTDDLNEPFPEEANRRLISQIATIHFSPTKKASENLNKSNILKRTFVVGNTVIDALISESSKNLIPNFLKNQIDDKYKIILATFHRRENWGENIKDICSSILEILEINKQVYFVIPMHKNKIVRNSILKLLSNNSRIKLTEPLKYNELIATMKLCHFILTDSGGIQEEAPTLGKPVLVLRNKTEREEAISSGSAKLVGVNKNLIINESTRLISDEKHYKKMSSINNPFGDGKSSKKILEICKSFFSGDLE